MQKQLALLSKAGAQAVTFGKVLPARGFVGGNVALNSNLLRNRFFSSKAEVDEVGLTMVHPFNLALIRMSRPSAKNALSTKFMQQMKNAVEQLKSTPVGSQPIRGVLIWSSVDGAFCSGADLIERKEMTEEEIAAYVAIVRRVFDDIALLPMPTVACIDGYSLAGGMELSLAFDFRVGTQRAIMGLPETSLGIVPGVGGLQRLPRLIGTQKAKHLIFSSKRICAAEALDLGVLDFVSGVNDSGLNQPEGPYTSTIHTCNGSQDKFSTAFPQKSTFPKHQHPLKEAMAGATEIPSQIKEAIEKSSNTEIAEIAAKDASLFLGLKLMQHFVSMGRIGMEAAKTAIRDGQSLSYEASWHVDRSQYEKVLRSKDRLEALAAFKEKRVPVLKGN